MAIPLTADEARAIADAFLKAAKAVDEYLDRSSRKISREKYDFLYETFNTLQRVSTFATTAAVGLAIDGLTDPVTVLKNVTEQAKEKIKVLEAVDTVISLATGLADLGASIIAKDPNAIVASVINLQKIITQLNQSAPERGVAKR
jgi:hypothetical protein